MFPSRMLVLLVLIAGRVATTAAEPSSAITSQRFRHPPAPRFPTKTLFEELQSESTGVDFVQPIDTSHPQKYLYVGGYASAGVAIGDLNGDGLPDLFFTGGPVANKAYYQISSTTDMKFREATVESGLQGRGAWSAGVTLVDIDSDGDLDVYICNYDDPNELYVNETTEPSKPHFVESAAAYGLDLVDACFQSNFCDYDLDGDLDVLVTGYQYVNPQGRPAKVPVRQIGDRYEVLPDFQKYYAIVRGVRGNQVFRNVGRRDYLLKNLTVESGKTRFEDVTQAAGISGRGVANSAIWWDFDADGNPDIFVANDFKVADQLWRNNGNGTFTDVVKTAFPHITWFSMGSDVGDVNNDGLLDLFVSDMAGTSHYRSKVTMGEMGNNQEFLKYADPQQYMRNALMINTGTPRFLEAAYMAGLASSDWTWTTKLADFDNDGLVDVYITNGAARMFNHSDFQATDQERIGKTQWDLWEAMPTRKEENLAFRNLGDLEFADTSQQWGLKRSSMSYAAAHGDLDNDGDLDLVVVNLDEPVTIYRNTTDGRRNSLRVRLQGSPSNPSAWGAKLQIHTTNGVQVRQLSPTTGFLSCNEEALHFGLGDSEAVDSLLVTWPDGHQQEFKDLMANRSYSIRHTEAKKPVESRALAPKPWFRASTKFPAFQHQEKPFDDFARQPLLPYAHSQLGPGLAVNDVDRDGDLDFYHGKPTGARRAIYEQEPARFGVMSILDGEESYEDMGALFFDADRDGDQDLYIVSGSVEASAEDKVFQDRLYLNDGKGKFQRDAKAIPASYTSGSVVCAADFDRDGDLDLFMGGRVVAGKYPVTPQSRFLENVSQQGAAQFKDSTNDVSPGLSETGLVTGAIWADVDNDGWSDLLVTHEWGPVKLFRNEPNERGDGRQLVDRTTEAKLQLRTGWWNGISAGDLDNDGDLDLVVTNFGLNTKYHASFKKPELLYYGNFDDTGKPHLLEAKFEADKCVPRRGMSCSSHAMPFVRSKMKTFHAFGMATLSDIYTPQRLSDALRLEANTLETGIWINNGTSANQTVPTFEFRPLPRLAQISPAYGVTIRDFDGDGSLDLFLAQNFYASQVETGRMDGGVGVLLAGSTESADLDFRPLWPRESGILIPYDATAAAGCDFNRDGSLDLVVATNNGPTLAYEGRPHKSGSYLQVTLEGLPGNLDCVGSRVTVTYDDDSQSMREIHAGSGYLTQESGSLFIGCGKREPTRLAIRWPDGTNAKFNIPKGRRVLQVQQVSP